MFEQIDDQGAVLSPFAGRITGIGFINTAYDPAITQMQTEYDEPGNTVVIDRLKLAKLFDKLAENGNRHKYILCDILFDIKTDQDSILAKSIARVKKNNCTGRI